MENVSVEIKEVSEIARDIKVSVPFDQVSDALTRALVDYQKQARVKGFRKGKAPIQMVKKMYGQEIESEALRVVLDESYAHALDQITLRIVGRPAIKDLEFSFTETKPFSYTASVEILPEIKPKAYKGLKINVAKIKVAEDQITQQLDSIRQSYSEVEPVADNRALKFGDFAVLDIQATCEGVEAKELC